MLPGGHALKLAERKAVQKVAENIKKKKKNEISHCIPSSCKEATLVPYLFSN
jgi:hypothetical protein